MLHKIRHGSKETASTDLSTALIIIIVCCSLSGTAQRLHSWKNQPNNAASDEQQTERQEQMLPWIKDDELHRSVLSWACQKGPISCGGRCGQLTNEDTSVSCYCDVYCKAYDDCCWDFEEQCPEQNLIARAHSHLENKPKICMNGFKVFASCLDKRLPLFEPYCPQNLADYAVTVAELHCLSSEICNYLATNSSTHPESDSFKYWTLRLDSAFPIFLPNMLDFLERNVCSDVIAEAVGFQPPPSVSARQCLDAALIYSMRCGSQVDDFYTWTNSPAETKELCQSLQAMEVFHSGARENRSSAATFLSLEDLETNKCVIHMSKLQKHAGGFSALVQVEEATSKLEIVTEPKLTGPNLVLYTEIACATGTSGLDCKVECSNPFVFYERECKMMNWLLIQYFTESQVTTHEHFLEGTIKASLHNELSQLGLQQIWVKQSPEAGDSARSDVLYNIDTQFVSERGGAQIENQGSDNTFSVVKALILKSASNFSLPTSVSKIRFCLSDVAHDAVVENAEEIEKTGKCEFLTLQSINRSAGILHMLTSPELTILLLLSVLCQIRG